MAEQEFQINKSGKHSRVVTILTPLIILLLIGAAVIIPLQMKKYNKDQSDSWQTATYNSDCNIQVVYLNGSLDTSHTVYGDGTETGAISTEIIARIIQAEQNPQIKGIILSVDSGGGTSVAGSEIADYLSKVQKPSVAWVRTSAASAAYWASLGAKHIIAGQNSSVGSIGVTYSYVDSTQKDKQNGLVFQQISIGKFKDSGNPNKPLTDEDKQLLLAQAQKVYENFVAAVAHYRNMDQQKVRALADGSVKFGAEALQSGLIDEVGGVNDVMQYFEGKTGSPAKICWK